MKQRSDYLKLDVFIFVRKLSFPINRLELTMFRACFHKFGYLNYDLSYYHYLSQRCKLVEIPDKIISRVSDSNVSDLKYLTKLPGTR